MFRYFFVFFLTVAAVWAGPIPLNKPAAFPAWWFERDVILRLDPSVASPSWPSDYPVADDYAAVNQGQIKNIARQAFGEMEARLPSGAGDVLFEAWNNSAHSSDDYVGLNLGQLKNLAKPFYDRLREIGYTGRPVVDGQAYPWIGQADDYALANIGQVKNIFSFNLDELNTDYILILESGDAQMAASGEYLPKPLSVRVINSQGLPVSGAIVKFSITLGGGSLRMSSSGGAHVMVSGISGISGRVSVFASVDGDAGDVNLVRASFSSQSVSFNEYVEGDVLSSGGSGAIPVGPANEPASAGGIPKTFVPDEDPDGFDFQRPLVYVTVAPGPDNTFSDPTKVFVSWLEFNSGGGYNYIVERRKSNGPWLRLTSSPIGVTNYEDGPLSAGSRYEYRVTSISGDYSAVSAPVGYSVPFFRGIKVARVNASGAKSNVAFGEYRDSSTPPAYYLVETITYDRRSTVDNDDGDVSYYHDLNTEFGSYKSTYSPSFGGEPSGALSGSLSYEGSAFQNDSVREKSPYGWTSETIFESSGAVNQNTGVWSGTWSRTRTGSSQPSPILDNGITDGWTYSGFFYVTSLATSPTEKNFGDAQFSSNSSDVWTKKAVLSEPYGTLAFLADTKACYPEFPDFGDIPFYWSDSYYLWGRLLVSGRNLNVDQNEYYISKGGYRVYAHNGNSAPIKWFEVFIKEDVDPANPTDEETRRSVKDVRAWSGGGESSTYIIDGSDASFNGSYYLILSPELRVMANNGGYYDSVEKATSGIPVFSGSYSSGGGTEFEFSSPYYGGYLSGFTFTLSLAEGSNMQIYGYNSWAGIWEPLGRNYSYEVDDDDWLTNYGQFYSHFKIATSETGQNADTVTLTLKVTSNDGKIVTNDSAKFAYQPPEIPEFALDFPVDDASGARYRKIALNGRPLSDEKPQLAGESDMQSEETFVDALTLGLRHSTTDIYVPVAGSALALSVRRNSVSEVWNYHNGLRPHERPDLPFGLGWSSNLIASIRTSTDSATNVCYAYVTDEDGSSFRFLRVSASWSDPKYIPFPSAKNEQAVYQSTLIADGYGKLIFTKKYGTTLNFSMAWSQTISKDRNNNGAGSVEMSYYRITSVKDRFDQKISYAYTNYTTLIPWRIKVDGRIAQEILIEQNEQGLVVAVWDPKLNKTQYGYAVYPTTGGPVTVLTSVTAPDGGVTNYTYDFLDEEDLTPRPVGSVGPSVVYTHADIHSIQDPLGNVYEFEYMLDHDGMGHGRFNFKQDGNNPEVNGYYVTTGHPRMVREIKLPNALGMASFQNNSVLKLEFGPDGLTQRLTGDSRREVVVTDAQGHIVNYVWSGANVYPVNAIEDGQPTPLIAYYQTMGVSYGELGDEVFTFDENAGLALSSVKDFSDKVTKYAHEDEWTAATEYYRQAIPISSGLNSLYEDPTSQTNALNKTRYFSYGDFRVMTSSTDELEVKTQWTVDSLGRRTEEQVFPKGSTTPIQYTVFTYGNTVFPNFLTKKTVKKLSTGTDDPTWGSDMVTLYVPDENGRVAQEVVDMNGNGTIDTSVDLITATTYDLNGNKVTSTDPNGNVTTFSYDKRNRLTHVTYADAHQKQFFYDDRGNKTEEIDERGVATFWQYDALNRVVTQIVDMDGSLKTGAATTHVLTGTESSYRVGNVHLVTSYKYNALNAKVETADPKGTVTKFEYDALQRLVKKTDDYSTTSGHLNYVTTYEYGENSGGRVFDSSGFKPTKVTDPRGFRTDVIYDNLYRPTDEIVEYATGVYATTKKEYDDVGNLLKVTAPPATVGGTLQSTGTMTETTYDELRRPTSVKEASGLIGYEVTTSKAYTSTGLAWKSTDAIGRITTTEYDAAGRPVEVVAPAVANALNPGHDDTPRTVTVYDKASNVVAVINPLLRRTDSTYDNRNRRQTEQLPAVVDGTNPTAPAARPTRTTAYDGAGNVIATQDARGFVTSTEYDNARRPVDVTLPPMTKVDGTVVYPTTSTAYDAAGNVRTLTDANGHVTTNTYDALNRLLTTTQSPTISSLDDIVVTSEYDAAGNRTAVIDGKLQRTEFAYDGLNRNTSIKDPAGKTVTFEFDALNKIARVDSENQRAEYSYDARRRLTDVVYVGRTIDNRSYTYDLLGQLLTVTELGKSGKANVAYSYDALGRQESETSGGRTHNYTYDLASNRISVIYSGTGTVLTSSYDVLNRLSTLTEGTTRVTTYGYDLNSNRVYQKLPNGEEIDTQYDPLNRTVAITTSKSSGSLLLQLSQVYDLAGNLLKLDERHFGATVLPRTVTNSYDNVNRLIGEVNIAGTKTIATVYGFDKANNRVTKAVATTTGAGTAVVETAYVYNNLNQLQTATEAAATTVVTSFTYDFNGNRKTRTKGGLTETYTYDYENRLVGLTDAISSGAAASNYSYVYDYRTRRVERSEAGVVTKSVFSGGVSVAEYLPAAPTVATVEYIRGSDWGGGVGGLLYSTRSGVPSFKHYNSRGDVISETDGLGVATWTGIYEAYGTRTQEVGSTQDRQKANTKEEDPTGLLNEGFRYRDLETGVFITRDPLRFVDGPNMYAYVVQNPWTRFDPEGLQVPSGFMGVNFSAAQSQALFISEANKSGKSTGEILQQIHEGAGQATREIQNKAALKVGATAVIAGATAGVGAAVPSAVLAGAAGPAIEGAIGAIGSAAHQMSFNTIDGAPLGQNVESAAVTGYVFGAAGKLIVSAININASTKAASEAIPLPPTAAENEITVYRAFGGDARAQGFSWTTADPRTVANFRDAAGLPSGGASGATNTADFLIQGKVNPADIIKSRSALPLDGNAGGLPELIIHPKKVNITDFSVLKP